MRINTVQIGQQRLRIGLRPEPGDATPLLLINGIGANLELFEPFFRALEGIPTITFDPPGIGGSSPPRRLYRLPDLARRIAQLLDHLGHDRVDILGVSWGGGLAQQFARQYPDRCRRLILAATSPGIIMVPAYPWNFLKLADPRRYLGSAPVADIAGAIYGGRLREAPESILSHARKLALPSASGYVCQLFTVVSWTSIHWLHRLKQPTLIMAGSGDHIVPLTNARLMARRIPNARLKIYDCGHLFLLSQFEQAIGDIKAFLTEPS
jgi:poly(3-hydroxyalkanoate) depolymerase